MRAINTFKNAAGLAAIATLLAACSSPVKVAEQPAQQPTTTTKPVVTDTRNVTPVKAEMDPLNDPNSPLAKRSVYFDFDQYVVKTEYSGTVNAHSKYLGTNKGKKVLIQGNTDERGGSEYNLALGQKRAEAVRKSLSLLGVPESQMEAVSLGKEKPKATGSDEASWAENRRADIIYSGK
ncbi:peptidoglycan-associated lipoprotein Pal [Undibacterium umbellatum]|uniref:Peptidoglycan-associated lipoprotein n=1 Tax=Undibacterium umbellatum TaxID=2762300 RepID=A0ABR6ZD00_9BURK|nr:peptidoglycan-associated lipoprotein Pal [Undibacterium umbellatum]MBC3909211.1 peptidoglycan-associated lipoprotein Pal [Undibacterium umbellatum]